MNETNHEEVVQTIIETISNKLYIIDEEMSSKSRYNELIDTIFDYLRAGFEIKVLREAPVYYKFNKEDTTKSMQLRHFLTNLIFWHPFMDLDAIEDLRDDIIVDTSKISSRYIENYFDEKIIDPYRERVSNKKLNIIIHDVIFNLSRISTDFNIILGLTINIESFIDVANKNERFNEIIHTKLDESLQPAEIEAQLHSLMEEEVEILKTMPNALQPMLKAGSGIKEKQLSEMTVSGGLKPDLSGNTIPIPINSNLLINGFNSVTNYYIDSLGGRKSLIANKTEMGTSGYFTKKVMMAVSNLKLSKKKTDCNTLTPLQINIRTKKHLSKLVGRIYMEADGGYDWKEIKESDTDLIGKDILLRSPVTCTCKNTVCRACYGPRLYHTNKNGVDVGALAGAKTTNPLGQNVLSTKHLLTTDSETIKFNDNFYKFFTFISGEISIRADLEEPERYSLVLINENIVTLSELNEGEFNEFVSIFHVFDKESGEMYEIMEAKDTTVREFYISPELSHEMKLDNRTEEQEMLSIDFMKISDDTRLFLINIDNNELTKPLYDMMGLLDSKKKLAEFGITNIHEMGQKMLDLIIEANLPIQSVHGEILLRPLIRTAEDILERPNFAKYGADKNCEILTLSSAIINHPSPLIGLSASYLKKQLKSPLTFRKRGTSIVDPFFKEIL